MLNFIKSSFLMSGVITLLNNAGVKKAEARRMAKATPKFFYDCMLDPLKNVTCQQKNIIATSALLIMYLRRFDDLGEDMDTVFDRVMEAFKYQLTVSDYMQLGRAFNTVTHILFEEPLMSNEEIEKEFCPSNLRK